MPAHERPQRSSDLALIDLLTVGEITLIGQITESSNGALLVEVVDAQRSISAIYKPRRFERPLRDFPPGLDRRELAAYRLSQTLQGCRIPPIVIREDLPFGPGSLQVCIDADFTLHYFDFIKDPSLTERLIQFAAFDLIANNADRKASHLLLDPETRELYAIDNALCFHPLPKLRTVIWELGGAPINEVDLTVFDRLATTVPDELCDLMTVAEQKALQRRCRILADTRVLPEVSEDRRPYPWPIL
ncbi:MAG: protein kinase family protein [Ferrimicrobium sp.]